MTTGDERDPDGEDTPVDGAAVTPAADASPDVAPTAGTRASTAERSRSWTFGPGRTGAALGSDGERPRGMIPARGGRFAIESVLMRIVATAGILGISVAIAAIMAAEHSHGWLIGLVVSAVSVVLAAVLWSSRRL